jgi:hypothetical protein
VGDVALGGLALLVAADEREPQRVYQHAELQAAQPDGEVDAHDQQERDEEERSPDEGGRGVQGRLDGISHFERGPLVAGRNVRFRGGEDARELIELRRDAERSMTKPLTPDGSVGGDRVDTVIIRTSRIHPNGWGIYPEWPHVSERCHP